MKLYLGGDASKGYTDWVMISETKKKLLDNFQLDDTFDGHHELFKAIKSCVDKYPNAEIYAALESTGGYENNWLNTLKSYQKEFNIQVARINPLGVAHDSKASMNRSVTDAVSALSIAEYLINHPDKIRYEQDDTWKSLKRHWNFVEMQKKQRVQTINQLDMLLYSAIPILLSYKTDKLSNWLLEVIILYPTANLLAKAKAEKLSKIPYLSLAKAKEIIASAQKSIASATDRNTGVLIKQIALQIKMFDQTIDSQMSLIGKELVSPEIDILRTFTGIDTTSAIGLALEIGAVERFHCVKSICSFFGLHPKYKQSGDKIIGIRMSKQGSKNMRKILFNITIGAIVHNPLINEVYQRKLSEGMSKMAAIGVCMHKILRIIYGMLKNKKNFDPQIDKQNTNRSASKQAEKDQQKNAYILKNRRFQKYDKNAPISIRQTKKRKEHILSQCEIASHSAGSTCSS
jgi:transposase